MVKIVEPSVEILTPIDGESVLKFIESCGRTCYQSYERITPESAERMIKMLIKNGHESVLEHFNITIKMICNIGDYKDLTRHRHASFSIESTRFIDYSGELKVINPVNITKKDHDVVYYEWLACMRYIEDMYRTMKSHGCKPDQLRMILPHSTAAEVCMTANLREWRHIFKLRTSKAAHPSVQQVMKMTLDKFKEKIPVVFDDLSTM